MEKNQNDYSAVQLLSKRLRLERYPEHSFGCTNSGNQIIQGNNNTALKILRKKYLGRIKCIYIDPPYNNKEKYNHYDDDKEHSVWLSEVSQTLLDLKDFLSDDGSIWISIDDTEMHYLKVEADKIFGRKNFITTIVWQQRTTRENRKIFSNNHEYILVYATNPEKFKKTRNLLLPSEEILKRYKNYDNDERGPWQSISANVQAGHATSSQFYTLVAPNGKKHSPPNGRCWVYNKKKMLDEVNKNNIWFGKDGNGAPRIKKFLNGSKTGVTPETLWIAEMAGTNDIAKKHILELFPNTPVFDTPKPEQLVQRILHIATNEGDIVLDAYLGAGSTISTAHKMNRRYIGIEKGAHVLDCVIERMKKVVRGEQGGCSKSLKWSGGGGFDFYRLVTQVEVVGYPIVDKCTPEKHLHYSLITKSDQFVEQPKTLCESEVVLT